MVSGKTNKCWAFTHYDVLDIAKIWEVSQGAISYVGGQVEKCPSSGRLHLQGIVIFSKKVGLKTAQSLLLSAKNGDGKYVLHTEPVLTDSETLKKYCSKDKTKVEGFKEYGVFTYVKRNTVEGQQHILESFIDDIKNGMSLEDLRLRHSSMYLNYNKQFVELYNEYYPIGEVENIELFEWQKDLLMKLEGVPEHRKIYWYYDPIGGKGKSTFTNWYCQKYGNTFITDGGCHKDIAFAYERQRVVIFDYPRDTSPDSVNYSTMECFKNQRMSSSKYQSVLKQFSRPHVVVFANFLPNKSKMSHDKFVIVNLLEE